MSEVESSGASSIDEIHYTDGKRVVKRTFISEDGTSRVIEHTNPDALQHYYPTSGLNAGTVLYSGSFGFDGEANADRTGDVQFRWFPHPRVVARGERNQDAIELLKATQYDSSDAVWVDMAKVILPNSPILPLPPEKTTYSGWSRSPGSSYAEEDLQPVELGDGTELDRITFLIPNGWISSDGAPVCDPDSLWHTWRGRLSVNHDGWDIVIDSRSEMADPDFRRRLKDSGGYCATHVGQLSRTGGAPFSAAEATDLLEVLRLALTFACGRTVNPVLPVGWSQGQAVWATWAGATVDPYRTVATWVDPVAATVQITELIGRMLDYCKEPFRREVVRYAISYLVTANFDVDAELAVAVPVSGMQLLAHHRLVDQLQSHSPAQFEDLNTETQIRLLLEDCDVDMSIPGHFTNLAAAQASIEPDKPPRDALGTAVYLRNKIIHPTKKKPSNWNVYSWHEASIVSRYYLTLAILNTIGYSGTHHSALSPNRWEGTATIVPWATSAVGTT